MRIYVVEICVSVRLFVCGQILVFTHMMVISMKNKLIYAEWENKILHGSHRIQCHTLPPTSVITWKLLWNLFSFKLNFKHSIKKQIHKCLLRHDRVTLKNLHILIQYYREDKTKPYFFIDGIKNFTKNICFKLKINL